MIKKKSIMGIMVTFALIAMSLQAYSQYGRPEVKVGFTGGLNLNNVAQDYDESDMESATKMRLGFRLGAVADYPFTDEFSLQSGILFVNKGYNVDLEEQYEDAFSVPGVDDLTVTADGESYVSYNYLEIPINVVAKIEDFQISAGPYVAFNIGGKQYTDATVDYEGEMMGMPYEGSQDIEEDSKLKPAFGEVDPEDYDDDEAPVNGFDFGLNFAVGYDIDPVVINVGYSLGLGNTAPKYDIDDYDAKDYKTSNRVIYFSVSYFLEL